MTFQPGDVVVCCTAGRYKDMVCVVVEDRTRFLNGGVAVRPLCPTPYVRDYLRGQGRTYLYLSTDHFKLLEETP